MPRMGEDNEIVAVTCGTKGRKEMTYPESISSSHLMRDVYGSVTQ